MKNKIVLISGGTGMIGSHIIKFLVNSDYDIIVLTRNPDNAKLAFADTKRIRFAKWDIANQTIDEWAISESDALIHLAGAGVVAKPWTESYKKEILESRVLSSQLLVQAISAHGSRLKTVISASAIGWYGSNNPLSSSAYTEEAPASEGFLGDTCKSWEQSILPVLEQNKRLVICRIGIVLANEGGALPAFKKPLAFRVAGVLGSGNQMVSWVHIHDLCRIFLFALTNPDVKGIYNAVAPHPVTNKELTLKLAESLYGKGYIPIHVPAWVLKLMMGERSIEVLKSTTVSASKIEKAGFVFDFPNIYSALSDLAKSFK